MRRLLQSIRFRLSLGVALAVFAAGSFTIGGIYLWQVRQLDEPVLESRPVVIQDLATGRVFETDFDVVFQDELQRVAVERLELEAYREALNQLRRASFGGLAALFVASFGAGWLLSGWALRPVNRMNNVARDITANDLSRRISLGGPDDELRGLADTFDSMLDRLQDAFDEQRRFVHEASHELRNPLAVARTNLEVALGADEPEELRRSARIALGSTERMTLLVEDLLEQARHGVPELTSSSFDLTQLAAERAVEFRAAASERDLEIETKLDAACVITGDGPAVGRAVSNLLANSVRLAPEGSTIGLVVERVGEWVELRVVDEGPGIPIEHHESIFDRFWRGADSGSGSGLGLALVRRVAERHGGSASVASVAGSGSTFTVRFPLPIGDR